MAGRCTTIRIRTWITVVTCSRSSLRKTRWEAWADIFKESSKSLYKMSYDDGPVLSFDTGNEVLHYFATPSGSSKNLYGESGLYQAHKGDFEFIVMSAKPEEVVLKGKRSGNKILMYPLDESPETFIEKATTVNPQGTAASGLAFLQRPAGRL